MSEKLKEYLKKKSNLLNAAKLIELGLKNRKLTIDGISWEQFKDGKEKLLLSFVGVTEKMVIGMENATTLKDTFGDNEEAWKGKEIVLMTIKDQFQGQTYDKIVIAV